MGKSRKLKNLVKNVQFFVKKCREKNKKLLSLSSLEEKDEMLNSGIFTDEKTDGSKSFKENSAENISKMSSESKYEITHEDFATAHGRHLRRSQTQGNLHTLSDYFDRRIGKKMVKFGNDGSKRKLVGGSMDEGVPLNDEEEVRTEKSYTSSVGTKKKKQSKDRRMEEMKNEILECDLHLLSIYKKLEKGSKSGRVVRRSGTKKGGGKGSGTLNMKAQTIKTYNSEVMSIKKELSLRRSTTHGKRKTRKSGRGRGDEEKDRGGSGGGKIKGESSKEHTSRGVKKRAHEEHIQIKHSFSGGDAPRFDSKSSVLTREETFSKYHQISSSKNTFDNFYFFQEGLANRLNKKQNTSSFDIGCMYMNPAISTRSSKDLGPKGSKEEGVTTRTATSVLAATATSTFLSSSKSFRRFKFLSDNKKNIEYYKQMIDNLEGTVEKSKKRSNKSSETTTTNGISSIDSIIKIINCLLHDYVPKLIDRYEYYMNTLDDRNKLLKKKIRESLDFGDLQYEEIRELKSQVMQKNQENKKLNDTIEMLKDKLSYVNEMELKNAEYLDEIMLMRNRVTYLERLIEENDQSKESHELRKMRHNLRRLYNKMKTEMRHMKTLKSRSFNRNKRGKFSIRRWIRLEEKMNEHEASMFSLDQQRVATSELNQSAEKKKEEPKQYADKSVDTSDMQSVVKPVDVVSGDAQCAQTEEGEKVKKSKVRTKNKKINTIVSNRTFLELLRREESMATVGRNSKLGRGNIMNQSDRNSRMSRSSLCLGSDRCTRIPMESYPYYHYFYSNMLATSDSRPVVSTSRIWPLTQVEKEPNGFFPPKMTLSDENYLSLCSQLKECIYQNYFEECAAEPFDGEQPLEKIPQWCDASLDQAIQNGKNWTITKGGNRGTQNDQPLVSNQMVRAPEWKSPLWKDTPRSDDASTQSISRGKNKCYKMIPFDCCRNLNRILTGEMNCSSLVWGCNGASYNQSSGALDRKRTGRKRSTISSNSSWERKDKLKMTRVVRKNHPFLRNDTVRSKNKHRYYYHRIGRAANGEDGSEGETNQMANCTRGNDHHKEEKQNEHTCFDVSEGGDTYELHIPQKWNKGIDLGRKILMDGDSYRSTYDKERMDNFKKFLAIYNSHFEGDQKGNFIGSFKKEQRGPTFEKGMFDQAVQAQVGGKEEDHTYTTGVQTIKIKGVSTRNRGGDTIDCTTGGTNKEHSNTYQISSHYNRCRVHPLYISRHSNEVQNIRSKDCDTRRGALDVKMGNATPFVANTSNWPGALTVVSGREENGGGPSHWINPPLHRDMAYLTHIPPGHLPQNGIESKGNETIRYHNSLNQFFDINTKDFEAINKYLHGHVLYTHTRGEGI
ncbi:conserved Plasmodium protein, unknown function [Plasmodium knowlesi strain H]|uniref:Liprin-beta-1/2 coiled-coil domain-containing protein n=3 Tax=Plasmodium knowlesi TaxID=5850 RepID=A0A5K1VRB3_PLAKH|nr:conserved Plasmodium protein, unknown function [Plasmodium knowlesi strain H]OTN68530.1 Uncharacterized protein PKNOH_S02305100 [Plasmodium knowlesi]CAA9986552.1 conserved Plasmodium protein, unknown function [Plasmodium knowlesi strain H]SBO24180.1 conserved Plasmodium protein, unknown function [Plasmodium knowlesi strain H]SBO29798.1 conserved Plasmodium protein, unknown function [Plasmodium knowlesi strain H]VVS76026.1 conserved Plasmodium protein, unknown function [Plasmodium knowlesi s|eukprot:XP_002261101.1 hypothetical protein, conserved in Plasmodium species [Plasmodium knowlesi strain H]